MLEELEWDCASDNIKYHKIMGKKNLHILGKMKFEEGFLTPSHSHHFERCVPKYVKKRVETRSWWRITPHHIYFRATTNQPWLPRNQILNTLIHKEDPTGRGVITIIELVTLKKPIGKFMGSCPIGKVTKHMKMDLEVIVLPMMNHHNPISQPTKLLSTEKGWSYFRNSSHVILQVPPL